MKRTVLGLVALAFLLPAPAAQAAKKFQRFTLVKDNTQFACDLYEQLRKTDGNLFFSPYSISTALGMTYGGARGDTAKEMAKALHFSLESADLHSAFSDIMKEVADADNKKRGYQLTTANALWGQQGAGFTPEFLKLTKDNYGAGLQEVDFIRAAPAARKTINDWAEKETKNTIKDLIPDGLLNDTTRLVLTNAIYFKGTWLSQFKKDATKEDDFHLSTDKDVQVPFMKQDVKFGYYDNPIFQMLELPYVGEDVTMLLLLPKEIDGLPKLEKLLTAEALASWIERLRKQDVVLTLPKFKATSQFQLKSALSALGMPRAFTFDADFSGMNSGKESLRIADVVHKAFVDVNEEGTEAGAATAVVVETKNGAPMPKRLFVFRADHPFLFLIRDNRNDSVLFLGRMANPK
jgi:serine protease inhibitor